MTTRLMPWGLAVASLIGMAVPGVAQATPGPRMADPPPIHVVVEHHPESRELPDRVWIARTRAVRIRAQVALVRRAAVLIAAADRERRQKEAHEATTRRAAQSAPTLFAVASGQCGGDLPPCWIMMRESGGNPRAQNPSSSASGKWQILDSTWGGFGGYAHAKDAPEAVQDARARQLGICNWEPPNYCA